MQDNESWNNKKEQGASLFKLKLLLWIFKIFGRNVFRIVLYPIVFCFWGFSSKVRKYSQKYQSVLEIYSKANNIKFERFSSYKHLMVYAECLLDKVIAFSGEKLNITFVENKDWLKFTDIVHSSNKGAFLICSHHGNIEALPSIVYKFDGNVTKTIHAFMKVSQSPVFHKFVEQNTHAAKVQIHATENIDMYTGMEISDLIDSGEIVMMAGDRAYNSNINVKLLNRSCYFPRGVFKLAVLTEAPVFFVSCIKKDNQYVVEIKKGSGTETELAQQFAKFLEQKIIESPINWFNFYDFFNEENTTLI